VPNSLAERPNSLAECAELSCYTPITSLLVKQWPFAELKGALAEEMILVCRVLKLFSRTQELLSQLAQDL
jgi:hypothetical protein